MRAELIELTACLASVESMIQRASLLTEEYEQKIRSVENPPPVASLKHIISFPEVRSIELLCKDVLERTLPDYPELAKNWYVHDVVGSDSPEELHSDLVAKRSVLQHAVNLIRAKGAHAPVDKVESTISLPKDYQKLVEPVRLFFEDHDKACLNYEKNVFIMSRFQAGDKSLELIDKTIRTKLLEHGLVAHRADDRCYPTDRNLWDNVCTYMFCCKYGIAVLENIIKDEFNPNVALEYGFMRALGKPTLLLKEQRFKARADILGTIWENFDMLNIEKSVGVAISRWLNDIGI